MILSEAIKEITPCVVQITANNALLGTGFMVSEDAHVITARHVINAIPVANRNLLRIAVASPNIETERLNARANFSVVACEVVDEDERNDVAILRMLRNPFRNELGIFVQIGNQRVDWLYGVPSFQIDRPDDGIQIAVSGYPLSSPTLLTNAGWLATAWAVDIKEVPMPGGPPGRMVPDMKDVYIADLRVNPGNSGGPAYAVESAKVIGVCVSHFTAPVYQRNAMGVLEATDVNGGLFVNAGIANIIPMRYVVELMTRNNINIPEPPADEGAVGV